MADNFLEKHYIEYEAKKMAWQNGQIHKNKSPLSLVSFSAIDLPSNNFEDTKQFYSYLFSFVEEKNDVLSMPNGSLKFYLKSQNNGFSIRFTLKMISKYQFERLLQRIKERNICFNEDENSITDPSGNIINIEC